MSSQQQWQHWSPEKKCMMPCKGPDVCGLKNSDGTTVKGVIRKHKIPKKKKSRHRPHLNKAPRDLRFSA